MNQVFLFAFNCREWTNRLYFPRFAYTLVMLLGIERGHPIVIDFVNNMNLCAPFSFFMKNSEEVLQKQEGVLRTNCIDCLDRTNVTQVYDSDLTESIYFCLFINSTLLFFFFCGGMLVLYFGMEKSVHLGMSNPRLRKTCLFVYPQRGIRDFSWLLRLPHLQSMFGRKVLEVQLIKLNLFQQSEKLEQHQDLDKEFKRSKWLASFHALCTSILDLFFSNDFCF